MCHGKELLYCFASQRVIHSGVMHIKTVSQPRGIWWGVLQQWFKGRVANKEQSVYRACTPLIWPHVVSWWMSLVLGRRMLIPTIGAVVQNPPAHVRDVGLISGLGRSPGEGKTIHFSILAWKILWTEEPGGLQSMGSQRVDTTEHTCMMTFCWEFWFCKELKDIVLCISWGGIRTLPQGCSIVSWLLLSGLPD